MVNKSILGVTWACLAVVSFNINAAIIDNGLTTLDTDTGYEWLDVTETTNCSYEIMSSGGNCNAIDLNSWTFASTADVYQLWSNAGITIENSITYTVASTAEIISLVNLVGITFTTYPPIYGVNGFVSDASVQVAQLSVDGDTSRDFTFIEPSNDSTKQFSTIGGWFYQTNIPPVPLPAAVWLFGSGLIGLIGFARRKT